MLDLIIGFLVVLTFVFSIVTYIKLYKLSKKYNNIHFQDNLSGMEVAEKILEHNEFNNIYIVETKNFMEEKYDSNRKVIKLLPKHFHDTLFSNGLSALYLSNYVILEKKNKNIYFRNSLLFVADIITYLSYICIIISALIRNYDFLLLGGLSLFIVLIFHLCTLSIEKKISLMVLDNIKQLSLVSEDNYQNVKDYLNAYSYHFMAQPINLIIKLFQTFK